MSSFCVFSVWPDIVSVMKTYLQSRFVSLFISKKFSPSNEMLVFTG